MIIVAEINNIKIQGFIKKAGVILAIYNLCFFIKQHKFESKWKQ
jgi:hypothetical protein